ncbi:hypothetical protein PBI_HOWE_37 [Gordonia phage Howe]|uniref:Uncharacterized protein n=2 Tax=Caudoviricetes TaxID=2731619 RepID=A0A0U4IRA1_9CAUD|nr:hypothetical protein PP508_gp37 [Gordonia phage Samman98]YP_010654898.1 hypothetical protein PP513_gp37 [Gordonia phage Howe]QDF16817.1 hypothetical protein SEA_TWINKLE_36 [Gordonia phage Twinkle]UAJ16332.1 hypothetical protein SEA_HORTENSE_37 [Gordonia phage Hortense]ALY07671.1 hypothetical protein PBI_HOWE_37 [Gordonia phage Howe]QYC54558.1 hypothetical protein SEA_SAMMAN98_37 [Gordonia phage Samman98]
MTLASVCIEYTHWRKSPGRGMRPRVYPMRSRAGQRVKRQVRQGVRVPLAPPNIGK